MKGKPSTLDVAILGAGVLGTSLAYQLARRGARVTVFEREPYVAAHASGKNAGMIRQLYREPQLTEWTRRSIETWPKEARAHFRALGSCVLGRRAPEHHRELFEEREVLASGTRLPAVFCASDGLLDSPSYVDAIRQLARKAGATFCFRTTVTSLRHQKSSWQLELQTGERVSVGMIANCCGAWLNQPLRLAHEESMVAARAYARHLFLVEGWSSDVLPFRDCGFYWDEHLNWYMRLWDSKLRLLSICERDPVYDVDRYVPSQSWQEELANRMLQALPGEAAQLRIRSSWHCFRTYCDDQLPIWGFDPQLPDCFWLAAFGGFGMSTSYAAAEDAALSILGREASKREMFSAARVQNIARESAIAS